MFLCKLNSVRRPTNAICEADAEARRGVFLFGGAGAAAPAQPFGKRRCRSLPPLLAFSLKVARARQMDSATAVPGCVVLIRRCDLGAGIPIEAREAPSSCGRRSHQSSGAVQLRQFPACEGRVALSSPRAAGAAGSHRARARHTSR
jgi:hypothetical protein